MSIKLTKELIEAITQKISGYEIYGVNQNDCLSSKQLQSFIRWDTDDIFSNWDAAASVEYIHWEIKDFLRESYTEEDVAKFINSPDYEYVDDIVWDTCSNDPIPQLISNMNINLTYFLWDIYNVEENALLNEKYGIVDYEKMEEEYGTDFVEAIRLGILMWYSTNTLYHSYFSENEGEHELYRSLHQVTVNNFDTQESFVSIKIKWKDFLTFFNSIKNGDYIFFTGGHYWYIDTGMWTGYMEQNAWREELTIPGRIKFNRWQLFVDEETGTYPYFRDVVWRDPDWGEFYIVEKWAGEEDDVETALSIKAAEMAEWRKKYNQTWCGWFDCTNINFHETEYINHYPSGFKCRHCWRFFVD